MGDLTVKVSEMVNKRGSITVVLSEGKYKKELSFRLVDGSGWLQNFFLEDEQIEKFLSALVKARRKLEKEKEVSSMR